jgi:hypothetical protein
VERNKQAITWITSRLWHVAESCGAKIVSIDWKKQENEKVFVVEIQGKGGKKAAKLFDHSELSQCPLVGEEQMLFDSRLSNLVRFFKLK